MLGAIAVASAGQTQCALDGAASVDSFANAALNIWAATHRCEEGNAHTAMCAVDIASSIGAVNDMITTMVGAVDGCGAIKSSHYECGMAIGGLTSASAALAASTAGMLANCPTDVKQSPANPPGLSTHLGSCVVDAKMSMTALFDAAHKFSAVKKESNAKNDLNVVLPWLTWVASWQELSLSAPSSKARAMLLPVVLPTLSVSLQPCTMLQCRSQHRRQMQGHRGGAPLS